MTDTNTEEAAQVDTARALVQKALRFYTEVLAKEAAGSVDVGPYLADMDLLLKMADNVTGWTHTTRLREFLEAVGR